jgi:hypothetical protein
MEEGIVISMDRRVKNEEDKIPNKTLKQIKELKPRFINYKGGDKVISFTSYSEFMTCEYKWKLLYIDKVAKFKPNINLIFGDAIHLTLGIYLKTLYNESGVKADELDLGEILKTNLYKSYTDNLPKNEGNHFSTPEELSEFCNDGIEILEYFKKNRKEFFQVRGFELLGIETELSEPIEGAPKNIFFKQSLDVVLYDKDNDEILIKDFKTSTKGWSKWEKEDKIKTSQLFIYRESISKKFNIPIEKIKIEYIILKRKETINSYTTYPVKRISGFTPVEQKKTRQTLENNINLFLEKGYNKEGQLNVSGSFEKVNDKFKCRFCQFLNTELCTAKFTYPPKEVEDQN